MQKLGPVLYLLVAAIQIAVIVLWLRRPTRGTAAGCLAVVGAVLLVWLPTAYVAVMEGGNRGSAALLALGGLAGVALMVYGVRGKLRALKEPPEWQCRGCGYDLRGSPKGPCAECGRESIFNPRPGPPASAPHPGPPGSPSPRP